MAGTIRIPKRIEALVESMSGPTGPESRFDVSARRVEYDGIVELLVRERTPCLDVDTATQVAGIIAAGCLGERHLWRDLELPDRDSLNKVIECYFSPLAGSNYRGMRWKKYLYRRLCRWEGFHSCPSPSCRECSSYFECFSPEE